MNLLIALVVILSLLAGSAMSADPMQLNSNIDELRYCGAPLRAEDGTIIRSQAVLRRFRKAHPCPMNNQTSGACPGWSIDHVIPLVCGGCDAVANMQWLPNTIKSCAGSQCKDRWERRVYCGQ